MAEATGTTSKRRKYILGGLFLGGIIAGCVFLVYHSEYIIRFQQYGYLGLFIMTIVTGFSIPLPVPYMVFTFTLGGLLQNKGTPDDGVCQKKGRPGYLYTVGDSQSGLCPGGGQHGGDAFRMVEVLCLLLGGLDGQGYGSGLLGLLGPGLYAALARRLWSIVK
jgi:hypothetical protein